MPVGRGGRITLPAGDGRIAFIDMPNLAEAAVDALYGPTVLAGKAVTLTGPRAIGFDEVATLISAAAGRPVRYDRVSRLLGRPATDIATFVSDNRAMWRAGENLSAGRPRTP